MLTNNKSYNVCGKISVILGEIQGKQAFSCASHLELTHERKPPWKMPKHQRVPELPTFFRRICLIPVKMDKNRNSRGRLGDVKESSLGPPYFTVQGVDCERSPIETRALRALEVSEEGKTFPHPQIQADTCMLGITPHASGPLC